MRLRLSALLLVPCLAIAPIGAREQSGQDRVTVVTKAGDSTDGRLIRVADGVAMVEIAGQEVRFKLADLRYISFVGPLSGEARPATASSLRMKDAALESMAKLEAALTVGVTRLQYSTILVEHLTPVVRFVSEGDGWHDVRRALAQAISVYQEPRNSDAAWQGASETFRRAGDWARFARGLATLEGEATHVESQEIRDVRIGTSLKGRLGYGDRTLSPQDGAFVDTYRLSIDRPTRVVMVAICHPCIPHIRLRDAEGTSVASHYPLVRGQAATISQQIEPGQYSLLVGSVRAGEIGHYQLTIEGTETTLRRE